MAAFLNTSMYAYTFAGTFPVVQQVVGSLAILKNIIGAVNDLAKAAFSCSSFTTFNENISHKQLTLKNRVKELEEVLVLNDKKIKAVMNGWEKEKPISNETEGLSNGGITLRNYYVLPELVTNPQDFKQLHTSKMNYITDGLNIEQAIKGELIRIEKEHQLLEFDKCVPACERLHNIAIGVLTAIPVIGTIYNSVSLYYIHTSKNR